MIDIIFYVFAALALGGAMGVVAGRSPVASLLFMVLCLGSVAGIYVLLEAHFLAAVQVIVYAGAIMVLFLFVIMLLNLGARLSPGSQGRALVGPFFRGGRGPVWLLGAATLGE